MDLFLAFAVEDLIFAIDENRDATLVGKKFFQCTYYWSNAVREMKKRKFNFCLGVLSCFLVSAMCSHCVCVCVCARVCVCVCVCVCCCVPPSLPLPLPLLLSPRPALLS